MAVAVILCGFLAGLIGQAIGGLYVFSNYSSLLLDGGGFISKRERASQLGQFFDYQLTEGLSQSVVGIYLKKNIGPDVLSQAYLPSELKGQGIILTSDGWLLTTQEAVKNFKASQLVIIFEQKSFEVDKLLTDPASGGVFIHAIKTDNRNWPAAKIASQPEDLQTGQAALVISNDGEIITTNIKNLNYQSVILANNIIQSADNFSSNILIKDELGSNYLGAPLINLTGEVIGLVGNISLKEGTVVIPTAHLAGAVDYVLKENKVKRPYLGANYIDLAQVAGLSKLGNLNEQQLRRGALLYNITAKSPAAKSGLIKGDIIIKVEDEQINHLKNLTDSIQEFKPGDKIKLIILRDGVDKEIEVVLGEQ